MQDKSKCLVGRRQYKNHALTIFFTWVTKQQRWHFWDHIVGKCTQLGSWKRQSQWKIPSTAHSPWWESQRQTVNTFLAQRDFLSTSPGLWRAGWSDAMTQDTSLTGMHCRKWVKKIQSAVRRVGSLPAPRIQAAFKKAPKKRGPRGSFLLLSTASKPQHKRNSKKKRK